MTKTITIELPEALLQPLVGLIDAGIRAAGLRSVKEAAHIVICIEAAAEKAKPSNVVTMKDAATG